MTPSAAVILPDRRVSATELRAAALDGELIALGEGFLPVDAPNTALARASSLAPALLDARVIIADRSAAWVWGWSGAPTAVMACVAITARIPSPDRRRLRAREVVIDDDERTTLGAVAITTPLRTMLDLARHDPDDGVSAVLAVGIRMHRIGRAEIEAALRRRASLSFVRSARARLLAALQQAGSDHPLLTR